MTTQAVNIFNFDQGETRMMQILKLSAVAGLCLVAVTARADIDLTLTPSSLDLGTVAVGSSAAGNVTIGITFDGNGALNGNANNGTVSSIAIINPVGGTLSASPACVGTAFSASSPGDTCSVQVDCAPGALGSISGDLEVQFDLQNNSGIQTQTTALSCEGVAPVADSIPTMGVYGLGILSLLLAVGGWLGLRKSSAT